MSLALTSLTAGEAMSSPRKLKPSPALAAFVQALCEIDRECRAAQESSLKESEPKGKGE